MVGLRYLLDTNILSDLIKNPHGKTYNKLQALQSNEFATSVVMAAELRYGALLKGSERLHLKVNQLFDTITVLAFPENIDRHYAQVRAQLRKQGQSIGQNDLWIAAHALAIEAVLVTDNVSEFQRVVGLRVENWL